MLLGNVAAAGKTLCKFPSCNVQEHCIAYCRQGEAVKLFMFLHKCVHYFMRLWYHSLRNSVYKKCLNVAFCGYLSPWSQFYGRIPKQATVFCFLIRRHFACWSCETHGVKKATCNFVRKSVFCSHIKKSHGQLAVGAPRSLLTAVSAVSSFWLMSTHPNCLLLVEVMCYYCLPTFV